jgi:hypothetical protein
MSPAGDFKFFLANLEMFLNSIYINTIDIIICGDFNINNIQENHKKLQLDSLLASYSLYSTVTFLTRISGNSASLIDNIFINT